MATTNASTTPSQIMQSSPHENGTSLIARAEALNAFMKMQPAADQARHNANAISTPTSPKTPLQSPPPQPSSPPRYAHTAPSSRTPPLPTDNGNTTGCFCFGGGDPSSSTRRNGGSVGYGYNSPSSTTAAGGVTSSEMQRPKREYYPDNLSVQPKPHPWDNQMEWLIVTCIDFLERFGLCERNLFAVSAVDDLVRAMSVPLGSPLPTSTDPHVAAGVIKAKIRHADEPLVPKHCLREYIDTHVSDNNNQQQKTNNGNIDDGETTTSPSAKVNATGRKNRSTFQESFLAKTVDDMSQTQSARRAYILARFMRLLGRVSANIGDSKMNAHCLAKCVAPSMLHWDPNSNFALLMLGKITAYVMDMIEDARIFDEQLCFKIDQLEKKGAW